MSEAPDGLAEQIASYRSTREHIERETLPLATSVDGVTFEFQASLHGLTLERGCYVMLEDDDGARLGQVTDIFIDTSRVEMSSDGEWSDEHGAAGRAWLGVGPRSRRGFPSTTASSGSRSRRRSPRCSRGRTPIGPGSRSASCSTLPASRRCWTAAASTGTRSCAGSRGPARRTRWACCWNRSSRRPSCASSSWTPTPTTWGWARFGRTPTPRSRTATGGIPSQVAVWGNDERADHPLRLRFAELDTEAQAATLGLDPMADTTAPATSWGDDLRLAMDLADHADGVAMARYRARDLVVETSRT